MIGSLSCLCEIKFLIVMAFESLEDKNSSESEQCLLVFLYSFGNIKYSATSYVMIQIIDLSQKRFSCSI